MIASNKYNNNDNPKVTFEKEKETTTVSTRLKLYPRFVIVFNCSPEKSNGETMETVKVTKTKTKPYFPHVGTLILPFLLYTVRMIKKTEVISEEFKSTPIISTTQAD